MRFFFQKYPRLRIVFNPEFLTEDANFDFINQSGIILGGKAEDTDKVSKLYKARFGNSIPIIETDYRSSSVNICVITILLQNIISK